MPDENDLRFKPMKVQDDFVLMPDQWKVDFFQSEGELSRFFIELKENARLMGTRCPNCGSIYFWPRSWCHDCYVDCEWVEMSLKGNITVFSKVSISLSDLQTEVPYMQGGIRLEGARYAIVNYLRGFDYEKTYNGMPVRAEFYPLEQRTGRVRDFYFVPDE